MHHLVFDDKTWLRMGSSVHRVAAVKTLSVGAAYTCVGRARMVAHTYKFKTLDNNFSFGWEMGRIGVHWRRDKASVICSTKQQGPTAWEPPLYPFLIAGVFKLFGIYTTLQRWYSLVSTVYFRRSPAFRFS